MKVSFTQFCLIGVFSLLFLQEMNAQTFLGFRNSNYSGVYGVDLQPASLADNRLSYEFNVFGFSTTLQNNYLDIQSGLFLGKGWDGVTDQLAEDVIPEDLNGKTKNFYSHTDFNLFSIMVAPSRKHGFGLTLRQRNFFNVDGVNEPLAKMIYRELNFQEQFDQKFQNDGLGIDVMSYLELGLAYSRVVYEKGPYFVKAGGRVKLMSGLWGLFLDADKFSYTFHNDTSMSIHDISASYGHSVAFDVENEGLSDFNPREFFLDGNTGFGLDLGAVFEFRPDTADHYFGEGKYRKQRRDLNKYKYKVGLSLVDMGSIRFKRSTTSQNFTGSVDRYDLTSADANDIPSSDSIIAAEFELLPSDDNFRMRTPTALSLQIDYKIANNLYVNFTPYWAFHKGNKKGRVHALTYYTLAPRFEGKWWGIAVPVSLADNNTLLAGVNVRLGPFVVGSHNIVNILAKDFVKGADVHFAIRIPMPVGKPGDKDFDGVPNRQDDCPKVPGLLTLEGCPDPDAVDPKPNLDFPPYSLTEVPYEHVFVSLDSLKKPEPEILVVKVPGRDVELEEEGVTIVELPTKPKKEVPPIVEVTTSEPDPEPVAELPNKPEEKEPPVVVAETPQPEPDPEPVPEPEAPKPEAIALLEATPNPVQITVKAKPLEPKPLTVALGDLDNIKPPPDPKPKPVPSGRYSRGEMAKIMPYADLDGDGIPNIDDKCPEIPGVQTSDGCPELGKGEYFSEDAFQNIYFDVAKFDLRPRSRTSLSLVESYLKGNPNAKVRLAGHTDNSGTERYNVGLSDDRCLSARDWLVAKGIDASRIKMVFYGETRPAATNGTPEGRQLNRRVDITFFEE